MKEKRGQDRRRKKERRGLEKKEEGIGDEEERGSEKKEKEIREVVKHKKGD